MKKIKLGIIGTGLAAKNLHLPALLKLKDKIEITAVCNHTEKKAKEFSNLIGGVKYYLDYRDLLADPNVDAVDITLPIDLNFKVSVDSLKASKHIFLEKPLTGTIEDAKKLLSISDKYDAKILLAENFRYRKVYNTLKETIKKKSIGKIYAAQWNVFYKVTSDKDYGATKWRQHHKYKGGFMLDAGVHNIAALRMLFGEVKTVSAFSASVNPEIGKPDTMSVLLIFDSGVKVIYNLFFSVKNHWENKLLIFGDKGTIETNDDIITIKSNENDHEKIVCSDDGGYESEFINFYDAVTKRKKIISEIKDGFEDMKIVFAALKSAETNKNINL